VDEVVVDDGLMTFSTRTATRQAVCPGCGTVSSRVHGGYRRRLADVAVSGHRTVIDLSHRTCLTEPTEIRATDPAGVLWETHNDAVMIRGIHSA
jgi:hypothetical protein